ncbi:phospho-acceptor domain-containing protein [Dokdonia sp. Hel_I_63]|uniref:sensor histidine kinase n=1 Tax=unclassified Dokdonia TaxID=2615033 RepID=UPI00020A7535|nr:MULTISPECIES: ATP-binding protein [unclassified Dokdonia]AEE20359.1 histidine kinase [Dokdonia sp. 4H-3-7-5]TVZ23378.1 phospho-acceptor domain-containing protein [Dokdonia sp. Hel_I_63]
MNPLLKRQIRKYLPDDLKEREDMQVFFNAVAASYDNLDDQFKMNQRAMQISSDELYEANKQLREESERQQGLLIRLQSVINAVQPFGEEDGDIDIGETNLAEYISQQAEQLILVNRDQELLVKELALQNQELNDYAHIVSHDLKSPLRSIEALVSWLKEDYGDAIGEEGKTQIGLIVTHLEKMDALITGILNYSSIDKEVRTERKIDLNILVKETVDLMHLPEHITINVHKLPTILADRFKIQQLFQNLIGNAVSSIDKPKGVVEVIARNLDDVFQFEIKDNGKGINQAYFHKIFQVFQKLENDSESTGIGLSIVKKIVHFYDGKIWLDSTEGVGTTFYFTLPQTT